MTPQLYDNTVAVQHRAGQRLVVLQGQRGRHRLGARRRHRQAEVEVQHGLRRRQAVGQPEDQQRRRSLVPARGRQPGPRLHLRRQPGAALRNAEVPERLEPARPRPLHRLARRARRADRQAALVPAGPPPRPARLRPDDPRDRSRPLPIGGVQTEVVLVAGKMGKAFAYRADNGRRLWTLSVGKHQNDTGPLPRKADQHLSPATSAGSRRRWRSPTAASSCPGSTSRHAQARAASLAALRATSSRAAAASPQSTPPRARCSGSTSCRRWTSARPRSRTTSSSPAPTPGTVYAFDTQTGKTLWTTKAPAGINSFPAIDGDTLLVGAGRARLPQEPALPADRLLAPVIDHQPARRFCNETTHDQLDLRTAPRSQSPRSRSSRSAQHAATGRRARPRPRFRSKAASSSSGSRRSRSRSPARSRSSSRTSATSCTTSRSTARRRR